MELTSKATALIENLKLYEGMLNIFNDKKGWEYAEGKFSVGNFNIAIRYDDVLYEILLNYLKDKVNQTKKQFKEELEKEV